MSILVLNAGSSSLKFGLFDAGPGEGVASGSIDWQADPRHAVLEVRPRLGPARRQMLTSFDAKSAVAEVVQVLTTIDSAGRLPIAAVGHRVVHGGAAFHESAIIDARVKSMIEKYAALAPLHNPPALATIVAAETVLRNVPHVAVFDTAFFARLPAVAHVYPIRYEWYETKGIRRFGFHGISHAYCATRAAELLGRPLEHLRLVTCHLGNGCSATAIAGGQAQATTMGFTPLDGLMMGTRSGAVDPGILLHWLQCENLPPAQLEQELNHRAGLLGVSGVSADFRQVESAAQAGHARARLALDIYAARVRAAVGSLAVQIGGIDGVVFTAGVGENSATLRTAVCQGLECLGLQLDEANNRQARPDADIAAPSSRVRVLIIHTREDLLIAREARRLTQSCS